MKNKKFQRTREDFVCENCSFKVIGDGYTNHCPNCLYSKHVDVNPGDRACDCGGLMRPVGLDNRGGVFYIVHRCVKCGFEKSNKAVNGDNFQKLIEISTNSGK